MTLSRADLKRVVRHDRTPMSRCLNCGRPNDTTTSVMHDEGPRPGVVLICAACGHVGVLDDEMKVREPTGEEIVELAGAPEFLLAVKALGKAKEAYQKETGKPWMPPDE